MLLLISRYIMWLRVARYLKQAQQQQQYRLYL
jgi:hypothetical protein